MNRIVAVTTEDGRKNAALETMSNKITEGRSNAWALIYARGPEGEALEFIQVLGPVKRIFDGALEERRKQGKGQDSYEPRLRIS